MRRLSLGYNAVPASARLAINAVFSSGQFSPGKKIREFEEAWASLHKAKHAVFVNSGTDALRLSLLAMKEKHGWKDGSYVAVPALTFVATVNVIFQTGLVPWFVDVGMNDYLINPANLESRMEWRKHENIVAVVPVHLFGQSAGPRIYELAKKYELKVLEDSCETILNPLRGAVSCHSTYMAHHVTTGVGGMAVTNDMELNLLIRSYANHGRNASYLPGYFVPELGENLLKSRFRFDRIGYSSRGTEFEAALGLSQLEEIDHNVIQRQLVASLLRTTLDRFSELHLPMPKESHTFMMFPIVLRENSVVNKYDLCLHLEKNGIETRDMMPITSQPCYKGLFREDDFSVAKWINKNGFYIPCHPGMTEDDVEWVGQVFERYLSRNLQKV